MKAYAPKRLQRFVPDRIPATVLSRSSIKVMACMALWQGVKILLTEDARFGSQGYAVVRQIPGGMNTWGIFLIIAGLVTIAGSITANIWVKAAGLFAISLWCFAFGAGVLEAPTGSPGYFVLGYCAAGLVLVDESRRR